MTRKVVAKKKKKSLPTTRSSKSSPHQVRELDEAGHKIRLTQVLIGKRSDTVELNEAELALIPEVNRINVEELPCPTYPAAAPVAPEELMFKEGVELSEENKKAEANNKLELAAHEAKLAEYEEKKKSWEALEAQKPKRFKVNLWIPVTNTVEAKIDGNIAKIYHTLRGPVMAEVLNEDMNRAYVHSPCFLDPNVQADKIHFFPVAFGGFQFMIYKTSGIGESIPQESEMLGYAHFLNRNRAGDYRFRMRAAYHHIDASLPEGSQNAIVDTRPTREALFGLVPTSNTQEEKQVQRMRQAQAAQRPKETGAAQTPPAQDAPPVPEASAATPPTGQVGQ